MRRQSARRAFFRVPPGWRDGRGLTVLEMIVALAILAVALVAIYGLVTSSIRSFGVGEDFLDVQQNARAALERFSEEARLASRLIDDPTFFAPGPPVGACGRPLCAESVNFEIPEGNPVIPGCRYYVRFHRDGAASTFVRRVNPVEGTCPTPSVDVLASYVSAISFRYCDASGNCASETSNPAGLALVQVVRIRGDITVAKSTLGAVQRRTVGTDAQLRNVGAAAAPVVPSPTPTSPPRPTPGRAFQPATPTATALATVVVGATRTLTPTRTATRTATPAATLTAAPVQTATRTATPVAPRTPTRTAAPPATPGRPTPIRTVVPPATPTRTPTATATPPER